MKSQRRDFIRHFFTLGALQGLVVSPASSRAFTALLDDKVAQEINPDFDPEAYDFWSGFLDEHKVPQPIVSRKGQLQRGGEPAGNDTQPVFLHHSAGGLRNAAEIDAAELIVEGDVKVSLNASTIKVAPRDQEKLQHLQNAQFRVDVAQKTPILPVIEAMSYTVVSGIISSSSTSKSNSMNPSDSSSKTSRDMSSSSPVQSFSVDSSVAWKKMQNIILPGGEGRWALNLEAQKKDSLLSRLLQNIAKETGQSTPMIAMPGVALSALQSFNVLYGAMHAKPVPVIKSNPLRVFATQEAAQKTGAPGVIAGIMLKSGTYILIPADQAPGLDSLKDLTVIQGRVVPRKTPISQLDAAAADTLKDVTYVTFDVEVRQTSLLPAVALQKPA